VPAHQIRDERKFGMDEDLDSSCPGLLSDLAAEVAAKSRFQIEGQGFLPEFRRSHGGHSKVRVSAGPVRQNQTAATLDGSLFPTLLKALT